MSYTEISVRKASMLSAMVLATVCIAQVAGATPTPVPADAIAAVQAATISKQRAVSIALQAVNGGTVVLVVLERDNGSLHWSIDITGTMEEYEVWVGTHGKVLRIVTQPL